MAERDLGRLLRTLTTVRRDGVWRFESLPHDQASWADLISLRSAGDIAMLFMEAEGATVILKADAETPVDNRWVWLELSVYSDLNAIGFLAKVAEALASAGVPCNAVAAVHHDHIFVPEGKADTAIRALDALASEYRHGL
ncbi:MAG: ACT domain-containing protein [Pseudomonadota bacterium]